MKKLVFLIIVLIGTCPVVFAQDCTFRLSGHVHSTATHENLAGATVQLSDSNHFIITDVNGDFRFDSLCAGTYTVVITHASYDTIIRTATINNRNTHLDIDLTIAGNVLSEVKISGVRGGNTGVRAELSGRELEETRGFSFAEALSKINGVTLLQTGATIAKPVIHGLHSNRILTINNGVRQEGQQWGNEHAPEIDPFIANKLTVIRGVDELRYGSDAIGGVILVEPRALINKPGYSAEANTVYFTNNQQYVASAIWEHQLKKVPAFTYRLQGTFKKGANITSPLYRLNNTALEEKNGSFTAAWRKEHFNSELYYSVFHTRIGIFSGAHIGNLDDLRTAIAAEKPASVHTGQRGYNIERPSQNVNHHLLKWKTGFDINNNRFNVLIAGQYNKRQEYDLLRNAEGRGAQINLSIFTFSQEINWERPKKNNFSGTVGLVALQQDNSYSGRYLIPNYRAYSFGGYAIEKWARGKWDAQAGLRFDNKNIDTRRLQTAGQVLTTHNFNFTTLASSLHTGYKILPQWKTTATASLSTRAPHVNELLTNGIHHGSGTYEVGDINLIPENALKLMLHNNYTSNNKALVLDVTLYRNNIQNFIYQQPKPDDPVLTIRGAFPKIAYQATDALLQGIDFSATVQPVNRLSLTSRYALLRATNKRINDWLINMPSDRIFNEATYTFKNSRYFTDTYFSVELQNVLEQKRVPDEKDGPQDYKRPPAGYALLHADFSTTVKLGKMPLTIAINGRNLLNTSYREYLNAFRYFTDEMGRNIGIRLKVGLQHFY